MSKINSYCSYRNWQYCVEFAISYLQIGL